MTNSEQMVAVTKSKTVNISVTLDKQDLPLSCPLPTMELWDMHPKVYLALDFEQKATCPYCNTHYHVMSDAE